MKKYILTVVIALAFMVTNAQSVNFGAKVGLNISKLAGYFPDSFPIKTFSAGVFTEIKINDKLAVQPELLFSKQGNKSIISQLDASSNYMFSIDQKWNLSYINIPLMAKYYIVDKISLQMGPQIGILLSAKVKNTADRQIPGSLYSSTEYDIKDSLKKIDLGVNFAAAYDFSKNASINIRYNLGVKNINNEPMSSSNIRNRVLSVSLEYKY